MKTLFFDTHQFDQDAFIAANKSFGLDIEFIASRLDDQTARLAENFEVVCSFVNDQLNDDCLRDLKNVGLKLIALRSAGFNHVDLISADKQGLMVARVPSYSPHAVAEFAIGLLLSLSRKIHHAYYRVRDLNFSLDGLVGFELNKKTVGVIGTGKIGSIVAQIMASFGCQVLTYDLHKNPDLEGHKNIHSTDLINLCAQSDIISLHLPLTPETHHLIDQDRISKMKDGVIIINTGRGALINSAALLEGLKTEKIGGAALDVYEEEEDVFFEDLSNKILQDDILARLLTFPNVLITSHQAFLTREALQAIAVTTLDSIKQFIDTGIVPPERIINSQSCAQGVSHV